jgi:hypothetical protein
MSSDFDPATAVLTASVELRATDPEAWTDGSDRELAMRLERVMTLQSQLEFARSEIELALAERMETDEQVVPGVGVLRRSEATRTSWRNEHSADQMRDDLAAAVSNNVAIDVATGDIDPMKRNIALHAIRTAYEAIPSFSNLKQAGRDRLGLHIGDYRTYATYYRISLETGDET